MARADRESVDTFMSFTGVPETVAVQKLEEHRGNLNEAVNAHFSERDRHISQEGSFTGLHDDVMDIDDQMPTDYGRPPPSLLPFARDLNPSPPFDAQFARNISDSGTDNANWAAVVSQPRVMGVIPLEVKDGIGALGHSGSVPTIEDVIETAHDHVPRIGVTIEVDDDDDNNVPLIPAAGQDSSRHSGPSAPSIVDVPDHGVDIEEEMIKAAIEASKQEMPDRLYDDHPDLRAPTRLRPPHLEDADLAHAVSLSLQSAEQEKALRELERKAGASGLESQKSATTEEMGKLSSSDGRKFLLEVGSSSIQYEAEVVEDLPQVRPRRSHVPSGFVEATKNAEIVELSTSSSPQQRSSSHHLQQNGSVASSDEWGGISSEEHDEAVMLEAAMFGGISEGSGHHFPYAAHHLMQSGLERDRRPYQRQVPHPPSPSLAVQRSIREQQDGEFIASLQADRAKELKAKEEAEAALVEKRLKDKELKRKMQAEEETERILAAKEASLPQEPTSDAGNVVTLLVRMPDGSRRGRRFLKSDKLQHLFDFIDIGRGVKPGSYRLVRPYPRLVFGDGESSSSLHDLGLTSNQEALYLEMM